MGQRLFGAKAAPGARLCAGIPPIASIPSIVVAWPQHLGGCAANPRVPSGITAAGPGGAEVLAAQEQGKRGRYCLSPEHLP